MMYMLNIYKYMYIYVNIYDKNTEICSRTRERFDVPPKERVLCVGDESRAIYLESERERNFESGARKKEEARSNAKAYIIYTCIHIRFLFTRILSLATFAVNGPVRESNMYIRVRCVRALIHVYIGNT